MRADLSHGDMFGKGALSYLLFQHGRGFRGYITVPDLKARAHNLQAEMGET